MGTEEPWWQGIDSTRNQGRPITCRGPLVWGQERPGAARWGRGAPVQSVAVTNAKGGVGKSTTAINLSAALEELGRRVLLIDADPSGNAALGLFPRGAPAVGLADALLDGLRLEEVAVATGYPGLDVIPPGDRLSLCSEQMGGVQGLGQGREFRIRRLLKGLAGYDMVVVDTSPVLTPLNVAILYAVAEILIPIDPCVAALAGVRALEDLIRTVSEFRLEFTDAGPLTIAGVLVTQTDRTLVSKQIESEVRAYFGDLVYDRVIPVSVKFREAYARGTPLIHYDPSCAGAEGYRAAARAYLAGGRPGSSITATAVDETEAPGDVAA
jgi:chromosome partitioning protein